MVENNMLVELECCTCMQRSLFDFSKKEFDAIKCPKCGKQFAYNDIERVKTITERFYEAYQANHGRMQGVSLSGIRMEETRTFGSVANADDLVTTDLEHFIEVYRSSTSDVQGVLASIIDLVFVRLNDDAICGRTENLKETKKAIKECLFKADGE